jgi:beta-lactamase superfamily II metal-dependent hydrolase
MGIMTRTFHEVGHGAFYTESFSDTCRIVYDCGSLNQTVIDHCVDNAFNAKNVRISALFISHFHKDHINGIQHLLEKCFVERMFIPFLDNEKKRVMLVAYLLEGGQISDWTYQFIDHIEAKAINSDGSPVAITRIRTNITGGTSVPLGSPGGNLDSGSQIICDQGWRYVPFNFRETEHCAEIRAYIREHDMPDTLKEMEEWWKANELPLKATYKGFGDLNTNSLVVYSGPASGTCGCLYMGDYNAKGAEKWEALETAYSAYLDHVHTLQVPHHGSKYNFNPRLIRDNIECFVISAGESDFSKRTLSETIDAFKNRGKEASLSVITEKSDVTNHCVGYKDGDGWFMICPPH